MSDGGRLALEFETRFLYPFLFDYRRVEYLADFLSRLELLGARYWHRGSLPNEYADNLLPFQSMYQEPDVTHSGAYLTVDERVLRHLVDTRKSNTDWRPRIVGRRAVELFLTPYGTAVLSLMFTTDRKEFDLAFVQDFNRNLHFGWEWISRDPQRMVEFASQIDDSRYPITNLPTAIAALLGDVVPGGSNAERFDIVSVQRSLSVYTAVRLNSEADMESLEVRGRLYKHLIGLCGIWPSSHCGVGANSSGEHHLLLNRRHWCSVGHLGAAHLVSDQSIGDEGAAYNDVRLLKASDKFFYPYLTAINQRLALQAFSREAIAKTISRTSNNPLGLYKELSPLRHALLHYGLRGYSQQLSEEDTSSAFYGFCRRRMGVEAAQAQLQTALADIDQQLHAHEMVQAGVRTNENIELQTQLQEKVEWIEVFIVTVYAVELAHLLGEAFAPHTQCEPSWFFPGCSLTAVGVVTLIAMLSALRLWPDRSSQSTDRDHATRDNAESPIARLVSHGLEIVRRLGDRFIGGKRRWAFLWIFFVIAIHVLNGLAHLKSH